MNTVVVNLLSVLRGARLRVWLRHVRLGREWAGPFPFTPNPARGRAEGGCHGET